MSHRKKWLLIVALLTLTLGIATACNVTLPTLQDSYELVTLTPPATETPDPTAVPVLEDAGGIGRAYFRAWESGDYLAMYSLLAPRSQALVDSQSFVNRYTDIISTATVQEIDAQPLAINQQGNSAVMSVRVTWETAVVGPVTRDLEVPLIYEDSRWGIAWDDSLILPELNGDQRLFLDYRVPARANIYDVNGRALAFQGTVISLGVIPGEIEDEAGLVDLLSEILQKPAEDIQEAYANALPDWYVPIGDVREERLQPYSLDLQAYIGKGLADPRTRLARLYTPSGIAPHIVGTTGPIPAEEAAVYQEAGYRGDEQVGQFGLELWGEDYLNGERGGTLTIVGPSGEFISTVQQRDSVQARSIYTTLEADFQAAVEQALAAALIPLGSAGAVVVLDVNTSQVLAMASYPTFDPVVFDPLRPEAAVNLGQVLSDPARPLLNRATQGVYPSGSLFKVITIAAAINSGLYTSETRYTSTGTWNRLGDAFVKRDWREGGHGTVSLRTALVVSCNSCFYDAGYNLDNYDANYLPQTALGFGLGQETGLEIAEATGLIPSPEWKINNIGEGWATGDAVNMAIGQGYVQVTPLQMANIMAAIANGGILHQPSLVDRIGAGGGAPEEPLPRQAIGELPVPADTLAIIQDSLFRVANGPEGTATDRFAGLPVPVAGKTGTAEDPPRNSHAWFAGYAPAGLYTRPDGVGVTEPEIAIAVIAENAGEGSAVGAPIFRRIVELYYGITPLTPYPWE